MVIPFAAGGPTDVLGRIVGESMSKTLGQAVIIENVGGAGGMTGSSRVAKGKTDGSQFVLGTVGTHAQIRRSMPSHNTIRSRTSIRSS